MEQNEKQAIEEMAAVIGAAIEFDELDFGMEEKTEIIAEKAAEKFYAEGYRKQKEGEWIPKKEMYRTPSARNYYCSNCEKSAIDDTFMGVSRTTKYCPNCGAKMKGGAE